MTSYQSQTKNELIEILNERDTTIEEQKCYCIGYNEAMEDMNKLELENEEMGIKIKIYEQTHKEIKKMILAQMILEEEGELPQIIDGVGEVVTTVLPTGEKVKTMA